MPWWKRSVIEDGRKNVYSGVDAEVVEVFRNYLERHEGNAPDINLYSRLDDLELDSLDFISIRLELEEKYDTDSPEHAPDFETIGDVARYVKSVIERESGVK